MKSLQESLFDSDLVEKNVGPLGLITSKISNYIDSKTKDRGEWEILISDIFESLTKDYWFKPEFYGDKKHLSKLKDDEVLIMFKHHFAGEMYIMSKYLTNEKSDQYSMYEVMINGVHKVVELEYKGRAPKEDIFDIKTGAGSRISYYLKSNKFFCIKADKKEIEDFKKSVIDKCEIYYI